MAATCTWTGGDGTKWWSDTGNWDGCGGGFPQAGDSLVFPSGPAIVATSNDVNSLSVAAVSFGGTYTLSGNSLAVGSISAGFSTFSTLELGLNLNGQTTIHTPKTVPFGTSSITVTGDVTGGGAIEKTGGGVLALCGANSYAGGTTIGAGTLRLDCSHAIPNVGDVTVEGGAVLDLNGHSDSMGALSGSGTVLLGGGSLSLGLGDGSATFSGLITEPGRVLKTGFGVQTIRGVAGHTNSTYSTEVAGGTLIVDGIHYGRIDVGPLTALGGSGMVQDNVRVNGTLAPGTSAGTLTILGELFMAGNLDEDPFGGFLDIELAQPGVAGDPNDFVDVGSSLVFGVATINIIPIGLLPSGTYRLIDYPCGQLTQNGAFLGPLSPGIVSAELDLSTCGQVNVDIVTNVAFLPGPKVYQPALFKSSLGAS